VLTTDQPALAVARIAVGVIARRAEYADVAVVLEPAHHAVVRNVAPDQVAAIGEVDGPLGPTEPGGDPLDRGVALPGSEALVEHLDARVGVAGAGKVAERQAEAVRRLVVHAAV